jgi:general secretion pathway protein D
MNAQPPQRHSLAAVTLAALVLLAGPALLQPRDVHAQQPGATPGANPGGTNASRRGEPITLNFVNAEIEAVARTMATITGRNVVVDPRVKGTISLSTERPVPPTVAYNQFLAALRLQGYTVVESAGLDKVVPEADAKLQSGTVAISDASSAAAPAGNQIVTQIFRLNFENANNLVPVLRPLISPNNTINVNPGNNSLVITDYADNLRRMARIIAAMDVSNATDVEVLPLKHALAVDLAPLVQRLIDSGSGPVATAAAPAAAGGADTAFKTTIIAEPRSNALIVRAANPARVSLVKSLVDRLDQPSAPGANGAAGNIYVVYLKNADATKLAITLRAALASASGAAGSGASAGSSGLGSASSNPLSSTTSQGGLNSGMSSSTSAMGPATLGAGSQPSTGGQIQADPSTNSLIITAPEPQYRQLRAVIDRLDGRRAQVLVESLIVEVSADKAADFGIQWQGAIGRNGDSNIGIIGTNFGTAGKNIIQLALGAGSGNTLPSPGLNVGVAHRTNGVYVLGFLARFLEQNGDGNVLSTPNLLTLDNEEAKIVIGQNVPFVTGQYTNNNTGGGTVNPFTTVERKDVGLTLRVKPQINENGTVKLAIYQESSDLIASTLTNANGPTTTKRSIESNVLVEDGGIVVLGGLLRDEYSAGQDKVPVLGDVPVLGNLFRSENRRRVKTNLMVFLRPVVMRDAAATEQLSLDRYDLMRNDQRDAQPSASRVLPINAAPVMPSQAAPGVPGSGTRAVPPLVSPLSGPSTAPVPPVVLPAIPGADRQ